MLTIYIGATFQLTGTLQKDGAPADFTGWSLTASLYDSAANVLISSLIVTWLDQTVGLLTLTAQSTAAWPATKARIDMRLVTPQGNIVLGPPAFLRIAQSPLS